jgi:signal peptidase I
MRKSKKRAITGFGGALLFILAFAIFFNLNFKTVVVSGPSMLPTFRDGQRVLVSRAYWLFGPVARRDVVVLADEEQGHIIKRVYRLPGEIVDWVNVPKEYLLVEGEYRVPEGTVYLLGDNREESEDSRTFGPVPIERIIGKVIVRP